MRDAFEEWRGRPVSEWQELWGLPLLEIYRVVDSTNDVAREHAQAGAEQGTLIVAEEQTRGRGRQGRAWRAPAGSSLLMSMVLRPHAATVPVITLRLGMAAARAIESVASADVGLKWPNDLLISGKKVAGLLCEGSFDGERLANLVAGIGVNLQQPDDDWPEELAGRATSLEAATGAPVDPAALAGRLAAEWLAAVAMHGQELEPGELAELRNRDTLRGHAVTVDGTDAGVAVGVDPAGGLRLLKGDEEHVVVSGTVRTRGRQGAADE